MRQPHVRVPGRPALHILPRVNHAVARKSHSNNCMRSDEPSLNSTSPMIERGLSSWRPFQVFSYSSGFARIARVEREERRTSRLRNASSSAGGALNPLACTITVFEP